MQKLQTLWMTLVVGLIPTVILAAPYDGSSPFLCATITALECVNTGECQRQMVENINFPQFVTVDVSKKVIHAATAHHGKADIKSAERLNGHLILQGAQGERGWSMLIDEETGKMSTAVVGDGAGFVIFGACTPR